MRKQGKNAENAECGDNRVEDDEADRGQKQLIIQLIGQKIDTAAVK